MSIKDVLKTGAPAFLIMLSLAALFYGCGIRQYLHEKDVTNWPWTKGL